MLQTKTADSVVCHATVCNGGVVGGAVTDDEVQI